MTTVPTFKTLEQLIAAAEQIIDEIDVISFDVFDTIFVRRIQDPDLIKIPVARYIAEKANSLGIEISWFEIATLRNDIENQHRQRNGQIHPDYEACYDEFMPEVLAKVFADQLPVDFFGQVADYEVKLENTVLVPRQALVKWIESLHQRGKRLFLLSDIYLPSKYILRMAADKDLENYFEAVISSADSFNAKASGSAYPLVEEKYGLDQNRWLHLGDNPISDGTRPVEFGIRAMVIDDPAERQRKAIAKQYNHYSTYLNFWKGRNLQQVMLPLEAENIERDELYVQGFNQFGYLFGYFMQRLAERCKELKLKRVYFCSREGWMLKQCWDLFSPWYFPNGDAPESKYLYVSRISLARSMVGNTGLSSTEVDVALLPAGNETFADVCRIFGLDSKPFEPYLANQGLTVDDVISQTDVNSTDENRRKLGLLLMDSNFQALAKDSARTNRDAFVNYLRSEGFFEHQDIGVVDIGWLGTIHNNLFKAISHLENAPNVHGFLMCATRYIDYPETREKYIQGLVYDRHKFDTAGSLLQYIKDIIEEICRAPHTSLIAYDPDEGQDGFKLVFRDENDDSARAEQVQSKYYQPVQEGILDAVAAYAKSQAIFGYTCSELKPWLNFTLHRYVAFPDTDDVIRMQLKAHQDDFAKLDTANTKVSSAEKGLWQQSAAVLRFIPGLRGRAFKGHCFGMMRV